MILPRNGRVMIIDDQASQALPLLKVLAKSNIATTYFDGKKETMPKRRFNDVRVLFLDINLAGGSQPNWATERSMIITSITSIIEPNIPYILFVWSVNEDEHIKDLTALFDEELKDYKPLISLIPLQKANFFRRKEDDSENWELVDQDNAIQLIQERINESIAILDAIEPIFQWENVVADSTAEVTNEIVALASRKDLNSELKKIYYKLAEAMWGKQVTANANEIATKAVTILSNLLVDKLDFNINNSFNLSLIKEIKPPEEFDEADKAAFNSKLLLSFGANASAHPGNVYLNNEEEIKNFPCKALIADMINAPITAEDFYKSGNAEDFELNNQKIRDYKNENRKAYDTFEKKIRSEISEVSKFVTVEVSPICDFAQKKWKVNRICPGILWNSKYSRYIGRSENLYVSPILDIEGNCYYLTLDIRYISSFEFQRLKDIKPLFTLKHSFLTDIQATMSKHISRPGITYLS